MLENFHITEPLFCLFFYPYFFFQKKKSPIQIYELEFFIAAFSLYLCLKYVFRPKACL